MDVCNLPWQHMGSKQSIWLARALHHTTEAGRSAYAPHQVLKSHQAKHAMAHARSNHMHVVNHFTRERVTRGEIEVEFELSRLLRKF